MPVLPSDALLDMVYSDFFFFATDFSIDSFIDQHVVKLQNPSLYDTFYFLIPLPPLLMTSTSKICPIPLHPLSLLYFYLILFLPPLIDLDLDPPLCFPFFIFLYAPFFPFAFGLWTRLYRHTLCLPNLLLLNLSNAMSV
jgi:hypothetical protein